MHTKKTNGIYKVTLGSLDGQCKTKIHRFYYTLG